MAVASPPSSDPQTAVERMYREHGHVVLRRGRRLLGSDAEAQELLHDVFATLLQHVQAGAPLLIDEPVAWLYAVATRRALTRIRDSGNRRRLLGDQLAPLLDATPTVSPSRRVELAELLGGLPADELRAIVYFHVDEMTHDEIAAQLGCSRRHVGNLLVRGRRMLRAAAEPVAEATS